jgi:hypothetical protein
MGLEHEPVMLPRTPPEESTEKVLPYQELLDLTAEQEAHFRALVERQAGKIRIIIHPFGEYLFGDDAQDRRYVAGVRRIVKACAGQMAVVLWEEREQIPATKEALKEEWSDSVFVVPTKIGSPGLDLDEDPDKSDNWEVEDSDLRGMAAIMKDLGVNKVIVGGSFLTFKERADEVYTFAEASKKS